jgi:hypothetical protein
VSLKKIKNCSGWWTVDGRWRMEDGEKVNGYQILKDIPEYHSLILAGEK